MFEFDKYIEKYITLTNIINKKQNRKKNKRIFKNK